MTAASTTASLLDVHSLSSGYGRTSVIRDVSITVGAGEVVLLLGPNGAGKTTTLRAVSNLTDHHHGTVRYDGEATAGVAPHLLARRGLAHLPQGRGLFHGLTVRENLVVAERDGVVDCVAFAVEHFPELDRLLGRLAGQLSGGEQQMLALARALARHPRLLLVDELSLGLAPQVVERLMPVLRTYADETGAGVLLVEQHVGIALGIADRGYVMTHGRAGDSQTSAALRAGLDAIAGSYLGRAEDPQP